MSISHTSRAVEVTENDEGFFQKYHWEPDEEVRIVLAGAPGQLDLGYVVPAGKVRRVREITVRHTGTGNTVLTLLDGVSGRIVDSFDVLAQSTRVWSSQNGRKFRAGERPAVQSSDITAGETFVSASGVEAPA